MHFGTAFLRCASVAAIVNLLDCGVAVAAPLDLTTTTGGFVVSDAAFVQPGAVVNDVALIEDPLSGLTFLANDPFSGESGVQVPTDATKLVWDYYFSTTGNDSVSLTLLDAAGGPNLFQWVHDGSVLGPGVFTGDDLEFDLAGSGLQGAVIGMEFLLIANLGDTSADSVVRFRDVRFVGRDAEVPIAATPLLCLLGLAPLGLQALGRAGKPGRNLRGIRSPFAI